MPEFLDQIVLWGGRSPFHRSGEALVSDLTLSPGKQDVRDGIIQRPPGIDREAGMSAAVHAQSTGIPTIACRAEHTGVPPQPKNPK